MSLSASPGSRVVASPWRRGIPRPLALLTAPLTRLIARRLLLSLVLLLVVSALTFVLTSFVPGDPARAILGVNYTPERYEELRTQLGLDLPLWQQYTDWLSAALRGDFGRSLYDPVPVTKLIVPRLPVTLSLTIGTIIVSLVVGAALGIVSAVRGGVLGRVVDVLALIGLAFPAFWVGAVLISIFGVELRWLPTFGWVSFTESPIGWLRSLILPVASLSAFGVSVIAKQTRESMLDVLDSEYIRMARASGIGWPSLIFMHALKNAGIRILTVLGVLAVSLLGGTVMIEFVFGLPGIGDLAVIAASRRDLTVMQGIVVFITIVVIVINLLVDLCYSALNPKVRTE